MHEDPPRAAASAAADRCLYDRKRHDRGVRCVRRKTARQAAPSAAATRAPERGNAVVYKPR
jgi:hypothetical protein